MGRASHGGPTQSGSQGDLLGKEWSRTIRKMERKKSTPDREDSMCKGPGVAGGEAHEGV